MYNLEEVYWWFIGQRRLISALVSRYSPVERPRILDVGCGTGGALIAVREQGKTLGCDRSLDALGLCRQRSLRDLVASRAESLAFRTGSLDIVLSCDVLEHIARDDLALAEMCRVLAPGGILIATVPAYPCLWSSHDQVLGHLRRYTRRALARVVIAAGFEILRLTYGVTFTLPVIAGVRWLERLRRRPPRLDSTGLILLPHALNQMLVWSLDLERWLILRTGLPWGCSLVLVARKPPDL